MINWQLSSLFYIKHFSYKTGIITIFACLFLLSLPLYASMDQPELLLEIDDELATPSIFATNHGQHSCKRLTADKQPGKTLFLNRTQGIIGHVFISFIVLAFAAILIYLHERDKSRIKMHQFETKKLREMDELKSRFFTNITHEFRTPLTLILGPVENLISKASDSSDKESLYVIQENARRLLALINQLLEINKIESGQQKLYIHETDIALFLEGIFMSFTALAKQKNITYQFKEPERPIMAFIDPGKFEKIILNLLFNAFKFTPQNGSITVSISTKDNKFDGYFYISISDSGPGIAQDQQDKIFDLYYQIENQGPQKPEGSGIGLSLIKELVELHHGTISLASQPGMGSTFTVKMPLGNKSFSEKEIVSAPVQANSPGPVPIEKPVQAPGPEEIQLKTGDKYTVLLVEDNAGIRQFIRMNIGHEFQIIEAENGIDGIRQTLNYLPDLIICDIMMPEMDGIEFSKHIKSDASTSHIPVILLTARASNQDIIDGLGTGVDCYITKPFETDVLIARIRNLIVERQKLVINFKNQIRFQPREIASSSMDEQFITRVCEVVEDNMSDPDLDVEFLAKSVHMSRQHLNRKLRAITNYSTRDFIRVMRLKRAAQSLEQQSGNITEIAYSVGFQNPSYFAEIFRKQFGCSPSEYSKAPSSQA